MASPSTLRDLKALRRLLNQADLVLELIPNPHPSMASAHESLTAALALSEDLIKRSSDVALKDEAAAALGAKGGQKTAATRDPGYYARIAAMRKTRAGGRPRKDETAP